MSIDLSRSAFVVRSRTVTLSRIGDALWWLAVPWLFVMLAVAYAAQRAGLLDLVATRAVVLAAGVAPLVLVFGSPLLGRLPGLRWLLATPQPGAILNEDGIELALPTSGCAGSDGRRSTVWSSTRRGGASGESFEAETGHGSRSFP